jgi:hypothetical protein
VSAFSVVPEIPVAGEPVSRNGSLAPFISAEIWLVTVSMHCVDLAFVAEQNSCRRET